MLINNININKYNARILDIDIQNSSIENKGDIDIINSLFPTFFKGNIGLNTITITLLINSLDKKQYYIDRSNLLKQTINPFTLTLEDRNLNFKCILFNHANQSGLKQIRGRLQLHIYAYNIEPLIVENINRLSIKTINVPGNSTIPCVVEIIPSIDIIDIDLEGLANDPIKIKNLKQGKKVILDGIEGTVTELGANKFSDTDFWEFPFLMPGSNTIKLSKNSCDVSIKYNARYL